MSKGNLCIRGLRQNPFIGTACTQRPRRVMVAVILTSVCLQEKSRSSHNGGMQWIGVSF
jgi:hypothetical protein